MVSQLVILYGDTTKVKEDLVRQVEAAMKYKASLYAEWCIIQMNLNQCAGYTVA